MAREITSNFLKSQVVMAKIFLAARREVLLVCFVINNGFHRL